MTQVIEKMELSYCQKNKWEDDWEQYWFYAKIGFPSDNSSEGVYYPLATKVEEFKHVSKADFRRTSAGYKECYSAFASEARVVGSRDLIEEYLAVDKRLVARDLLEGSGRWSERQASLSRLWLEEVR